MTDKAKETAKRILLTASKLFTKKGFYNVSIKEIAKSAECNSALISYYFGGKTELYLAILKQQAEDITKLQEDILEMKSSALEKLRSYLIGIKNLQSKNKQKTILLYREILFPTGLCSNIIEDRLEIIHRFSEDLVNKAIGEGSIKKTVKPNYSAFILESIIVLTFLAKKQLPLISPTKSASDSTIDEIIEYYLTTITTTKGDK